MTVGVLDVGCFSAHLVVVERDLMRPLVSHKVRLRLDRELDAAGAISRDGVESLCAAVLAARKEAGDVPFLPFATSSVRDSSNSAEVIRKVARRTGVDLKVLSGKEEARFSYAAARHWFGWSAGPMVVLDVGGGTVELAMRLRSGTRARGVVAFGGKDFDPHRPDRHGHARRGGRAARVRVPLG